MYSIAVGLVVFTQSARAITWYQWDAGPGANGHWYGVTEETGTWFEIRGIAQTTGADADLVSVGSAEEQAFLHNTFGTAEGLWIGLSDYEVEGNFKWSNGDPLGYTNWASFEPNDSGNEDFVLMNWNTLGNVGQWNDLPGLPVWSYRGIIERVPDSGGTAVLLILAMLSIFAIVPSRLAIHGAN